ncbi:aminoacyl-tRNA hydrolase [Patescibacteria group bacterium]|nr:aminoacyl-tRNA hydrolase [Patescibacteria group bacterium]MBU1015878.1 aminoacyl-tRNA hydrolase [Patescibacteria group bacterium]MBU1684747.1 aminoacyl-tRNA hydrolase [Patescibacteria group bacterium]MBU1938887.1 aminoacyl-tRNA hydrolase [Patescibacteria group bacterium]
MKLIVGLGNPGDKYKKTRHNAGFMAVEKIAEAFAFEEFRKAEKFKVYLTEGEIAGEKVILAQPQTFMNLSGQSVQALMSYYKLKPSDVIVIYDEAELPYGTLRIRPEGSAGGHKGMASVMQELATLEVPRIRIGIRPEKSFPGTLEDYVLGNLTEDEKAAFAQIFEKLPNIIDSVLKEGVEAAMNKYN